MKKLLAGLLLLLCVTNVKAENVVLLAIGKTLPTTATTQYFPIGGDLTATTATYANVESGIPTNFTVYNMDCATVSTAGALVTPGGTATRTFALVSGSGGGTVSSVTCAETSTQSSCTYNGSGVRFTLGTGWSMRVVSTSTPTASDGVCYLYGSIDR